MLPDHANVKPNVLPFAPARKRKIVRANIERLIAESQKAEHSVLSKSDPAFLPGRVDGTARDGAAHGHSLSGPEISRETNARNLQEDDAGIFRGNFPQILQGDGLPCFVMNTDDWSRASAQAMNDHMEEYRLSVKELARKIGCNYRTAENYARGLTSPSGLQMLRCIAVIPEYAAEVRRVTEMLGDLDATAIKAANDLVRAAQKFADARDRSKRAQPAQGDLFGVAAE